MEDIKSTYKVLEVIRQNFVDDEMHDEALQVNNTHYLVQLYEEESSWRVPRASDDIDPSNHQTLDTFESTGEVDVEQT